MDLNSKWGYNSFRIMALVFFLFFIVLRILLINGIMLEAKLENMS